MSIDVLNETDVTVDARDLVACCRHAMAQLRVHPRAELCIRCVDEGAMEVLHVQWMDLPGPTDVMSFPMDELRPGREGAAPVDGTLGDIVLCPAVAARQSHDAGHALQDELRMLTVHGLLHLLGFDHADPDQEREMFTLQASLLESYAATLRPRT